MVEDDGKHPVARRRRRAKLDELASILPEARRDQLAATLTGDDLETLRHIARRGFGANTLRAITSDFAYLEAWALAATGEPLPWAADEPLILKFIAHHLYDPDERDRNARHGMPTEVASALISQGLLRADGPHAFSTVKRRLSIWSVLHGWKGYPSAISSPMVKHTLRLARRAAGRPRQRKSAQAVTRDVLDRLLATCTADSLVDLRDRALLLYAFASGGRRRSEVANLKVENLVACPDVPVDPADPHSPTLPAIAVRLGRTKTGDAEADERVLLVGTAAAALRTWMSAAVILEGAVFRGVDRFGRLGLRGLDAQSVNLIVKKRCRLAGLAETAFSAHGLRSGYLTEAARQGVPLQAAMQQSRHRSVQQAANYYNEVALEQSKAARLV